jgi:hypothetical protein
LRHRGKKDSRRRRTAEWSAVMLGKMVRIESLALREFDKFKSFVVLPRAW